MRCPGERFPAQNIAFQKLFRILSARVFHQHGQGETHGRADGSPFLRDALIGLGHFANLRTGQKRQMVQILKRFGIRDLLLSIFARTAFSGGKNRKKQAGRQHESGNKSRRDPEFSGKERQKKQSRQKEDEKFRRLEQSVGNARARTARHDGRRRNAPEETGDPDQRDARRQEGEARDGDGAVPGKQDEEKQEKSADGIGLCILRRPALTREEQRGSQDQKTGEEQEEKRFVSISVLLRKTGRGGNQTADDQRRGKKDSAVPEQNGAFLKKFFVTFQFRKWGFSPQFPLSDGHPAECRGSASLPSRRSGRTLSPSPPASFPARC